MSLDLFSWTLSGTSLASSLTSLASFASSFFTRSASSSNSALSSFTDFLLSFDIFSEKECIIYNWFSWNLGYICTTAGSAWMVWVILALLLLLVMMVNEFRHTKFILLYVSLARLVQPILARLLLLLMIVNQIRHTDPGLGTCLRFWSFCIPSSWIQLGSWVGNLFQVLVLLYSV